MALPGRGAATRRPKGAVPAATAAVPASSPPDEPGPLFLVASYVVLVLLGAVLGLFGTFLLPAGPHLGTTLALPVGLAIAVIAHPLAAFVGLRLTSTRAGTVAALVGWAAVVLPLASGTAEGDVVLPGTLLSIIYLLIGMLSFAVVVLVTHPTRGRSAVTRR